jgi:transcriptional regulator with XRE-family HTH domain
MNNPDYVDRMNKIFGNVSMAEVARRINVPHATVQNYYRKGRLPATEVLLKIAEVTNVSLNWLLLGTGDMYAVHRPPIGLGQFIEEKIGEMIEQRFSTMGANVVTDEAAKNQ